MKFNYLPVWNKKPRKGWMERALETILGPEVQKLLNSFCACFGIRIHLFSPDGERLAIGKGLSRGSSYCTLLQKRLFGKNKCEALDECMRREAGAKRRMITYRCHAGLEEAVLPLYAGEHLLGFVMAGQFRCVRRIPKGLLKAWSRRRARRDLETAFNSLLYLPLNRKQDVLRFLSLLTDYLVSQRQLALSGSILLEKALDYIHGHLDRPIALSQVAAHIFRSESTLSHLFREKLGKSFKQAVLEAKFEKAEELLRTVPGITVFEAAAKVGYDDPFHFSALFKKYKGRPPSTFLRNPG